MEIDGSPEGNEGTSGPYDPEGDGAEGCAVGASGKDVADRTVPSESAPAAGLSAAPAKHAASTRPSTIFTVPSARFNCDSAQRADRSIDTGSAEIIHLSVEPAFPGADA